MTGTIVGGHASALPTATRATDQVKRLADDAMAQRLGHRFGLRVHVQLRVDALHMEGDGIDAAAKRGGGGLVAVPLGQQAEDP